MSQPIPIPKRLTSYTSEWHSFPTDPINTKSNTAIMIYPGFHSNRNGLVTSVNCNYNSYKTDKQLCCFSIHITAEL